MDKTEAQLIADIKKAAKAGQKKSCTIMAKDLVRTRKHREKFTNLCAQLRVMSLSMTVWRLRASRASFCDEGFQRFSPGEVRRCVTCLSQEVASQHALAESMKNVTRVRDRHCCLRARIDTCITFCIVDVLFHMSINHDIVFQAMGQLNKQINLPALQKTMADFQQQSEAMGMKMEVLLGCRCWRRWGSHVQVRHHHVTHFLYGFAHARPDDGGCHGLSL